MRITQPCLRRLTGKVTIHPSVFGDRKMIVEICAAETIEKTQERLRKLPFCEPGAYIFRQDTLHGVAQYVLDVIIVRPLIFGDGEAELDQPEIVKGMRLLDPYLRRVTVLEFHDVNHPSLHELLVTGPLRI